MKADLTVKLIKGLTLDEVPVGTDARGHLVFAPNPKLIKGSPIQPSSPATSYGTPTERRRRGSG